MLQRETELQAKRTHNGFNITDKNDIAELSQALKDISIKYPVVIEFLEKYCGYDTALLSFDPNEICYSQGKRDVILTIKTLMREDISPDIIAQYYKKSL
jgi:hypothetical protein